MDHTNHTITSEQDEVIELLDQQQQLLKQYERLSAEVSDRLVSVLGDKYKPQQLMQQWLQLKEKQPSVCEALKKNFETKMSSFTANQRTNDQKPLNRKGVRGRTWV